MDAPYEHNAGSPYEYGEHNAKRGEAPWENFRIAFDGPYETPDANVINSRWSVKDLNAKLHPWLIASSWSSYHPKGSVIEPIWGGDTLAVFVEKMHKAKGTIFWPLQANINEDIIRENYRKVTDSCGRQVGYLGIPGVIHRYLLMTLLVANTGEARTITFETLESMKSYLANTLTENQIPIRAVDLLEMIDYGMSKHFVITAFKKE